MQWRSQYFSTGGGGGGGKARERSDRVGEGAEAHGREIFFLEN